MNDAIVLGPLSIPVGLVLPFVAFYLAGYVGRRAGRRAGADPEGALYLVFLVALVAARLAFVVRFSDAYLKSPLQVVDIRDGGWTPAAGLLAGAVATAWLAWRRSAVRRPLLVAAATAGGVWIAGMLLPQAWRDEAPELPALSLSDLSGRPVALQDFAGRPTVVNLWATWCPPCRREMPVLLQAQAAHPQVHFVFLNQGEAAGKVQGFLASHQLPLRNVLLDPQGQAGAQLGHRSLPTTLFYDARGRLVDTRVGELSEATLAQRLQDLGGLDAAGEVRVPSQRQAPPAGE